MDTFIIEITCPHCTNGLLIYQIEPTYDELRRMWDIGRVFDINLGKYIEWADLNKHDRERISREFSDREPEEEKDERCPKCLLISCEHI